MRVESQVEYVCDWCGARAPAEEPESSRYLTIPSTWEVLDVGTLEEVDLCPECTIAVEAAVVAVRAKRRPATQLEGSSQEKKDG